VTGTGRAQKIVLIEDDPDIAALVEGILSDAGHDVAVQLELQSAAADPSVQLVITDLVALRGFDRDAARQWISTVRERFPRAAVILSTAHAPAADGGAQALGADAVLTKPFDIGQFVETVESLLDR
jgi:DNA-binding response OmpR family regulator